MIHERIVLVFVFVFGRLLRERMEARACDSDVEDMRCEDRCDGYNYCLAMVNLKFTAAEETGKGVRGKCRLKRVMRGGVASREEGGGRRGGATAV